MKTPVHREVEAWGWYVDRLADLAVARDHGDITPEEHASMRGLYLWEWQNHSVA